MCVCVCVCVCVFQPSAIPTMSDWQSVSERRIDLLSTVCKNSSLRNLTHVSISKFVLDRIFVCDKHKILFCQTPKVGNTQWKKVLIVLNGKYGTLRMLTILPLISLCTAVLPADISHGASLNEHLNLITRSI